MHICMYICTYVHIVLNVLQVEVRGFVHGSPQRKIRRVSSGKIQEFISVLLRESLPSGPTLLCLFVEPTWDVVSRTVCSQAPFMRVHLGI